MPALKMPSARMDGKCSLKLGFGDQETCLPRYTSASRQTLALEEKMSNAELDTLEFYATNAQAGLTGTTMLEQEETNALLVKGNFG